MLCSVFLWKLAKLIGFVINLENEVAVITYISVVFYFVRFFFIECGSLDLMDFDLMRKIRLSCDNFYQYSVVVFHFYFCLFFYFFSTSVRVHKLVNEKAKQYEYNNYKLNFFYMPLGNTDAIFQLMMQKPSRIVCLFCFHSLLNLSMMFLLNLRHDIT